MSRKFRKAIPFAAFFVVLVALLVLAAIPCMPCVGRPTARISVIRNNLRNIQVAKIQWATANRKIEDSIPAAEEISPFMPGHRFPPVDVVGEVYQINAIGQSPTATLSVKLGDYKAGELLFLN